MGSKSSVFSELGWYPLQISILLPTLSYWHWLKNTNTGLLSDAFACSQTLHENDVHSLFSALRSIFSLLDIPYANNELNCLNFNNFKNRGSYMRTHVLLILLNKLRKRYKMQGLPSILSIFRNTFNKFNNTGAFRVYLSYDIKSFKITLKSHFWHNNKCHKHVTNAPKGIGLA